METYTLSGNRNVNRDETNHKGQAHAGENTDIAIIGGGLAGLATACYLAGEGRSVALFERSSTLGGQATSQNHEGFIFNRGAHALYEKSVAVQVLAELGIRFTAGNPTRVRAAKGGKLHAFPDGPFTLLRTSLLPRAAKLEAARLLMGLQRIEPSRIAGISFSEWLDKEVRHPEVRQLLEASARVTTYSDAPDLLSAGMAAEQLQLAVGKVLYIDGGWQVLVEGLAGKARASGASINTGQRVVQVIQSSDGSWEIALNGESSRNRNVKARCVVLAVGPTEAARMLQHSSAYNVVRGWAEAALPVKAAALDVALRRLPRPENAVAIGMDRPLFLTAQSEFASVTPDGSALVHTLKYLRPGTAN